MVPNDEEAGEFSEEQRENRDPRLANLIRFKAGESGNPGGRPKGSVNITRHIREALERADEKRSRELADRLIQLASEGNAAAIKQVMDRIDGPVKEQVEHSGSIDGITDDERAARTLAILERGRARRTGPADE